LLGFSDEEGVRYQTTYLGSRAGGDAHRADVARVKESKSFAHGVGVTSF
jgi:hypothetical protein